MSARWIARIVGILMLLAFFIIMASMQRRLVEIQKTQRRTQPATTGTR